MILICTISKSTVINLHKHTKIRNLNFISKSLDFKWWNTVKFRSYRNVNGACFSREKVKLFLLYLFATLVMSSLKHHENFL